MSNDRFVAALRALAKTSEPSAGPLAEEEQELVDDLGRLLQTAKRPERPEKETP